jgi:molybdopterin-containing oxidoreductase family iron-sulfur binding subunit
MSVRRKGSTKSKVKELIEVSRREFLKKAGIAGAATVTGAAAIYTGYRYEKSKSTGETIKVLTEDNRLVTVPKDQVADYKPDLKALQTQGRKGIEGKKWIWVIDLAKCRNARKCVEGCQAAHHLRPYEYHINTLVMKESAETPAYFMPKPCQHCDNPPCVSVCPVDATFKRQDGPVLIDNMRCIGCRFCIAACPYSARIFQWFEPLRAEEDKGMEYNVELNLPQRKGTVTKCVMSCDRLRNNQLPYCVASCPNGVFYFGDENENAVTNGTTKETVNLKELLEINGGYRLMTELGTEPRVYYLPPKNKIFRFEEGEIPEYKQTT